MTELDLEALTANGTMSTEIAATLRATVERHRSFLVQAVPRLAGKSTVMRAMLDCVPPGVGVTTAQGGETTQELRALALARVYLAIAEISQAPVSGYLWGEPVRRAFGAVGGNIALAAALHAGAVDETFEILCGANRIPDEDAAKIAIVVQLRSLGQDWRAPTRRVVEAVYEVSSVVGGRPRARVLHRWDSARDVFETLG